MKKRSIAVAWIINAYQKPNQIIHIINTISDENDSIWLHYDKKSPKSELDFLRDHFKNDSRVHFAQKYSIAWGGFESVLADVLLAKMLLKSCTEFDYVIHFTGTTYPTQPLVKLREYLTYHYGKSFINLDPNETIHEGGAQRSQHFAKEHFGVYPGRNIPKYKCLKSILFRTNLKLLRFLSLIKLLKTKTYLPSAFPKIYRGFVHNVIFKDHYINALTHKKSHLFLKQLKYISSADEVFFNTLLTNLTPQDKLVRTNNLLVTYWRKGTASPDNINESDIDDLRLQSDRFFARKFESMAMLKLVDSDLLSSEEEQEN
jgi:hypothetical protein